MAEPLEAHTIRDRGIVAQIEQEIVTPQIGNCFNYGFLSYPFGINNPGTQCWFNSLVQLLVSSPSFCQYIHMLCIRNLTCIPRLPDIIPQIACRPVHKQLFIRQFYDIIRRYVNSGLNSESGIPIERGVNAVSQGVENATLLLRFNFATVGLGFSADGNIFNMQDDPSIGLGFLIENILHPLTYASVPMNILNLFNIQWTKYGNCNRCGNVLRDDNRISQTIDIFDINPNFNLADLGNRIVRNACSEDSPLVCTRNTCNGRCFNPYCITRILPKNIIININVPNHINSITNIPNNISLIEDRLNDAGTAIIRGFQYDYMLVAQVMHHGRVENRNSGHYTTYALRMNTDLRNCTICHLNDETITTTLVDPVTERRDGENFIYNTIITNPAKANIPVLLLYHAVNIRNPVI
jgi:hypothetical protein